MSYSETALETFHGKRQHRKSIIWNLYGNSVGVTVYNQYLTGPSCEFTINLYNNGFETQMST